MNNRNRCASVIAFDSCGCQDGTEALTTPLARNNRPGLPALSYRIGTHASFLETMKARLSSNAFPELKNLTARDSSDPSIALLDAWAIVADVLTFYQERIANEGYIRTATEERSIQELARLVGAGQRSGVAATVPLAYTIDPNTKGEVVIPAGSRVQSVPGQNEKPQTFETSEDLKAYAELNLLQPRMSRAQRVIDIFDPKVYLKGINTNLKKDDRMLIDVKNQEKPELYRVVKVEQDAEAKRTCVDLYLEYSEGWKEEEIKNIMDNTSNRDIKFSGKLKRNNDNKEIVISITDAATKEGDNIKVENQAGNKIICRVKKIDVTPDSTTKDQSVKLEIIEETESITKMTDNKSGKDIFFTGDMRRNIKDKEIDIVTTDTTLKKGDEIAIETKAGNKIICRVKKADVIQSSFTAEKQLIKLVPAKEIGNIYAFRTKAAPFGHNAPMKPVGMLDKDKVMKYKEWEIGNPTLTPDKFDAKIILTRQQKIGSQFNIEIENISKGLFDMVTWMRKNEQSKDYTDIKSVNQHDDLKDGIGFYTCTINGVNKGESFKVRIRGFKSDGSIGDEYSDDIVIGDYKEAHFSVKITQENIVKYIVTALYEKEEEDIVNWYINDKEINLVDNMFSLESQGIYRIKMVLFDNARGNISVSEKEISVYENPIPKFESEIKDITSDNLIVSFKNKSIGKFDDISWSFGRGGNELDKVYNSVSPEFTYPLNKKLGDCWAKLILNESISEKKDLYLFFFTEEKIESIDTDTERYKFQLKSTVATKPEDIDWHFGFGSPVGETEGKEEVECDFKKGQKYYIHIAVKLVGENYQYGKMIDIKS